MWTVIKVKKDIWKTSYSRISNRHIGFQLHKRPCLDRRRSGSICNQSLRQEKRQTLYTTGLWL